MRETEKRWANVAGFPNYLVSTAGEIQNHKNGYILNPSLDKDGRLKVNLSRNGVVTTKYVNRLVAQAFHPDYHPEKTVRYKDGDKNNNALSNLLVDKKKNAVTRFRDQIDPTLRR